MSAFFICSSGIYLNPIYYLFFYNEWLTWCPAETRSPQSPASRAFSRSGHAIHHPRARAWAGHNPPTPGKYIIHDQSAATLGGSPYWAATHVHHSFANASLPLAFPLTRWFNPPSPLIPRNPPPTVLPARISPESPVQESFYVTAVPRVLPTPKGYHDSSLPFVSRDQEEETTAPPPPPPPSYPHPAHKANCPINTVALSRVLKECNRVPILPRVQRSSFRTSAHTHKTKTSAHLIPFFNVPD